MIFPKSDARTHYLLVKLLKLIALANYLHVVISSYALFISPVLVFIRSDGDSIKNYVFDSNFRMSQIKL